ncbi:hypothetical protein HYY72_05840 [Candidatus Woesearchaeota archaeon]|nr:hypothetical protein [Candidatus Woesearchaeota archaeon]
MRPVLSVAISAAIAMLALSLLLAGCQNYDKLASCLSEKDVKMYGAYWCPHCASQKEMFGSSFDKISYVECSLPNRGGQTEICKEKNIESYPTWEFADGSRLVGEQTTEKLAEKTGCQLSQS